MDEKHAEDLITKLTQAAFNVGKHSAHPEGLMAKSETKKAVDLRDEIVRHLTSRQSRAANACACPKYIKECWSEQDGKCLRK